MYRDTTLLLGLGVILIPFTLGLSWKPDKWPLKNGGKQILASSSTLSPSASLSAASRLPRVYEMALAELRELESEPLCHRIAARLLVGNCELLDGKDEASALTDSGRQIRDFVDSYAASLAICDLERGSFVIPLECAPFREPVLSQLAMQDEPRLHVDSRSIEDCLTGLAGSDSAWNTWVSYRHKAVRFCEAARADNEKAQNIHLYQRLTKVIAKLADGVELEMQKRMASLDFQARQVSEAMDQLSPQVDHLRESLASIQDLITKDVDDALHQSRGSLQESLQNAETLQRLLSVMIGVVFDSQSQVAFAHEQSLEYFTRKTNDEINVFMAAMSTTVASSISLQKQIELSRLQAVELAIRQDALEEGMRKLVHITEHLFITHSDHARLLNKASNITNGLLDTLQETASSAASVQESLFRGDGGRPWWPYVICPPASLIMGSYGLPPSALRNLGLLALGEVVGFLAASYDWDRRDFLFFASAEASANKTTAAGVATET